MKTYFPAFLSVVLVVRNQSDALPALVEAAVERIAPMVSDFELIVVDNASTDASVSTLRSLVGPDGLPNVQVYALTKEVDADTAFWVGLENALGDFVAVLDPLADDVAFLPAMMEKAVGGADVVFANNRQKPRQTFAYRIAAAAFNALYRMFSGIRLDREAPQYRLLSKRVVNFLLQHRQPAMTYRLLPVTGGFAKANLDYSAAPRNARTKRLGDSIERGTRLLLSTTRAPMRMVTVLSLFGAVANLAYSGYVVAIAMFKEDIAPGWVSLSLQQSGMFLLISLVLMVLGEYILNMASLSNEGPRYHVGQEFTSARLTRRERLNIEEAMDPRRTCDPGPERLMGTAARGIDAVVVGGGFYGVVIAEYLVRRRGFTRVRLLEAGSALCRRASYRNQARVHNGYHYPRSFTTAYRSRVNLPAFVRAWPDAVRSDFTAVYAIARNNSKVTAQQFERFCREIGAPLRPAGREVRNLFSSQLIEQVYEVDEFAFDAEQLAHWAERSLARAGVEVRLGSRATGIERHAEGLAVSSLGERGDSEVVACNHVFNCTYSGLNQFAGDSQGLMTELKHEITEMGLVELPAALTGLGITVMDGPFFSLMPFPPRALYSLSHVRYTPHESWFGGVDADARLAAHPRASRVDRMIRDAARYVPSLAGARHVDSLFEVKTVLAKSEGDDGRPILFERHADLPGCYSILGGKIDNIFDVLEKLDAEPLGEPVRPGGNA